MCGLSSTMNQADSLCHIAGSWPDADSGADNFSGDGRDAIILLKKEFDNYKAAAEYDLMRYKLAGASLGIGYWDMVIEGNDSVNPDNKFVWSPELRKMLGYCDDSCKGDFPDTLQNWLEHLHPDDRERAIEEFVAHTADRTGKTQFVAEYRLRKTTGEYISVRAFGAALRDSFGAPVRIAGAVEEITEARMMRDTLAYREKTLDILNRVALVLLARKEKSFAGAMAEGLGLIAEIADIDRMSVFRNSDGSGGLCLSQIYRWLKGADCTVDVYGELKDIPYSRIDPRLESTLSSGESVGGHISRLPGSGLFKRFGCETVLMIPVFDDGKFWGFTFFERLNEEVFTEQETDVLRSASFMLANAVIRNEEAAIIRQTNEQIQTMLDAVPVSITIWDKDLKVIDCSKYAVDLFGYSNKQELMEHVAADVPEFQPGGEKSASMLMKSSAAAFRTGYDRVEWTQFTTGAEPILLDAQAIRIKYRGDWALMLFSRDIREEKKMMAALTARDEKLAAQAHWYKSLLDGIPLPISVTDAKMNLTFTNTAAEKVFGKNREGLIGQPCRIWQTPICGTRECSIVRAKQGQKQNYFKFGGKSCKIETEFIRDIAGETVGYLEVLHDITDVENLARRQADAANDAKSAFLAQMSHEMRTPLSAIIGLSELMLENGGLNPDDEVFLDKIYNAGSTLLGIVNDILDISKIEAGKLEVVAQEYDVPGLINDTIAQNILRIHSKPVRFALNINENVPVRLLGDDIRVKQILSNLLSNAFKYTNEGTVELSIDYEREGDCVWTVFRVSDTGIGIKGQDLDRLFTDYTRFDGEANRKIGGTGLGLSITKRLVELMDGNITATSEYGKGSVFTAKIRQRFVNGSVIGSEMAEHLRKFQYTTSRRRSGAQLERVKIPYARVLVVDDNKTNLDIAQGLMRPYGMDIDCVSSGREAVDAIRGGVRYDAVFMDHMMPDMDGVETVRVIREEIGSEYAKTVPIIALTANAVAGSKERFLSRGFNAFVSKPIDIFRLDEVIRHWIWDKNKDNRHDGNRVFVERRRRPDRRKGGDRREGERRNDLSVPVYTDAIEGIDWMKGLELFGDADSFSQVLRSFAVNTRPLLDSLAAVSEETLPQYAIVVHGVKSSSRGIGAAALGNMAESLEFAAKDDNLNFVKRHNPGFLTALGHLIADIETLLDKNVKKDSKPQQDRPGDMELRKLRAACENYNLDEIESVMQDIDRLEYTDDDGLYRWLQDNISRLNYTGVAEKITQVTEAPEL